MLGKKNWENVILSLCVLASCRSLMQLQNCLCWTWPQSRPTFCSKQHHHWVLWSSLYRLSPVLFFSLILYCSCNSRRFSCGTEVPCCFQLWLCFDFPGRGAACLGNICVFFPWQAVLASSSLGQAADWAVYFSECWDVLLVWFSNCPQIPPSFLELFCFLELYPTELQLLSKSVCPYEVQGLCWILNITTSWSLQSRLLLIPSMTSPYVFFLESNFRKYWMVI